MSFEEQRLSDEYDEVFGNEDEFELDEDGDF